MRIAVLWTRLSGYVNACLKELNRLHQCELCLVYQAASPDAPFAGDQFGWVQNCISWSSEAELESLDSRIHDFNPDILVFAGWHVSSYRKVARSLHGRCLRIMTMDNCWLGTLRQRAGTLSAPWLIKPIADAVWLPGERQANFATRLGFKQSQILRGLYSCDRPAFAAQHTKRLKDEMPVPRAFLFAGRFVNEKGVATLLKAYTLYRASTTAPWPLICCGAGPLAAEVTTCEGVQMEGFVQPAQLPLVMANAGCLILPSNFEPWGVIVHEATAAGLIVIASASVGSAVHLVQSGYNGFLCGAGDAEHMAELLSHISSLSDNRLDEMSRCSHSLSAQFSPQRWAETLIEAKTLMKQS